LSAYLTPAHITIIIPAFFILVILFETLTGRKEGLVATPHFLTAPKGTLVVAKKPVPTPAPKQHYLKLKVEGHVLTTTRVSDLEFWICLL